MRTVQGMNDRSGIVRLKGEIRTGSEEGRCLLCLGDGMSNMYRHFLMYVTFTCCESLHKLGFMCIRI
jgi:hypothetical protein